MNNHYVLNGGCAVAYPPYEGCTHIKGRGDKRSASTKIAHSKMEVVRVSMGFWL